MSYYIEPYDKLSEDDKDIQRALNSLKEEIEAIDWYHQRAAVCSDTALKEVILHNRNEEIEHAAMMLEWLRRKIPEFDAKLKQFLFSTGPLSDLESSGEEDTPQKSAILSIGSLKNL